METKEKLDVIVQHYISQGLIKLFSQNKKFVYEFNLQNDRIYPEGISTTMSSKYTYEHPLLAGNTLEKAFKTVEDEYIPLVKEVVTALENNDINTAKTIVKAILPLVLLFYYRSGATLLEFSDHNNFDKESVLNNMLKRILDRKYLDRLAATIINDYAFVALKSVEERLILSDQYVSTASLNCKGKIANFSNRTIGFSNCMILIPLSAKYYILFYNGSFSMSNPVIADTIYNLDATDLQSINKVILRNSYNKCLAMHKEELEAIKDFKAKTYGPSGTIMKYENGTVKSYTVKKEVFFNDEDEEIFEKYVTYCTQMIQFQNQHGRAIGRNDKCLCGSGKKLKKCCLNKYMQAKYIYDMIRCNQTSWMATKSKFVEMPINEFWGFENELPRSSQNIINRVRDIQKDETSSTQ